MPPTPINYGYDPEKEEADRDDDRDYQFGAESPICIAAIPEYDRELYLPLGEIQRGKQDFMDCATRSPVNNIETKLTFLYKNRLVPQRTLDFLKQYEENGRIVVSDRFIAILSGTTRKGNSLKAPHQAMHEFGVIPKKMLPASKQMSFNEYHNKEDITQAMKDLGKEFLTHIEIYYDKVARPFFDTVIEDEMIGVAGFAWPDPVNGEYPAVVDLPSNHAFLYYRRPSYHIFDNYLDDRQADDFIKKLAADYEFYGTGYRMYLMLADEVKQKKIFLLTELIRLYKELLVLVQKGVAGLKKGLKDAGRALIPV